MAKSLQPASVLMLVLLAAPAWAGAPTFRVAGTDPAAWAAIFGSVGLLPSVTGDAPIIVAGSSANLDVARLANTHIVILEGDSPMARQVGLAPAAGSVAIRHIIDIHAPKMQIVWEQQVTAPIMTLPDDFRVFARERWKDVPVLAGKRTANGAILWLATSPGATGMERYPYILQALSDLGLTLPVRTAGLWAFFDSSYRLRADTDYLAKRWRAAGVAALQVASWHNMEPDPARDEYLKNLIDACHRHAILVYAWLELPHVSEQFWDQHPEWREKTAIGQDAQLDWRKLMNLDNPDCKRAAAAEVTALLNRFDWDGVNLGELYFESLEGASDPARFTPMNDNVRSAFQKQSGFDPKLLFDPSSPYAMGRNPQGLRKFLDFRAGLSAQMQTEWLDVVDAVRANKPWMDVVLTHIDDRLEPGMRDALGADVARSLPAIESRHATLLVEDPATLWDLGPARYAKLAAKYQELRPVPARLAVDINVVERYQDVYPTKKQTGVELFQLVHQAALSFPRVALYFENSLEREDLALLPAAAANARVTQPAPDELIVDTRQPARVTWNGAVEIDGQLWPVQSATAVMTPPGRHRLTPGFAQPPVRLTDFNGDIHNAVTGKNSIELSYSSRSRAIATLGTPVSAIEVDGEPYGKPGGAAGDTSVLLPAGEHVVTLVR